MCFRRALRCAGWDIFDAFELCFASAVVTTFVGNSAGFADGNGTQASINGPIGLTFDASGNMVVSDFFNQRIRKVTPTGGAQI